MQFCAHSNQIQTSGGRKKRLVAVIYVYHFQRISYVKKVSQVSVYSAMQEARCIIQLTLDIAGRDYFRESCQSTKTLEWNTQVEALSIKLRRAIIIDLELRYYNFTRYEETISKFQRASRMRHARMPKSNSRCT